MGNTNTGKKSHHKVYRIIALILCICTLVGIAGIVGYKVGKSPYDTIPVEDVVGLDDVAALQVTEESKVNLLGKLNEAIEAFRSKYLYLTVQDSEDTYVAMLYNPNGEVYAQGSETGYTTVYLGDGKAVRYTDYVNYGPDSDMFGLIESAYKMAVDGKATVLTCTEDSEVEGYTQLVIDINGWDKLNELYSYVGEDYGDMMIEQLKSGIAEASASDDSGISADDEMNFRFAFALNDETSMPDAVTCYVYIGDIQPENVTWNDLGASWSYNGYTEVNEWKLLDKWDELDWETLSDWESVDPAEDVLLEQSDLIIEMMNKVKGEIEGEEASSDDISSSEQEETSEYSDDHGNSSKSSIASDDNE